jgi:hypothetical protein
MAAENPIWSEDALLTNCRSNLEFWWIRALWENQLSKADVPGSRLDSDGARSFGTIQTLLSLAISTLGDGNVPGSVHVCRN